MSYFEIGIYHPKTEHNIGTLMRSAYQLGAAGIFTIGQRYKKQASNTYKAERHIPLRCYKTFEEFMINRSYGSVLAGIEMNGEPLSTFEHPKQAIYLLGAEDHGLPLEIINKCQKVVSLESIQQLSYNVSVAGSIIMYNRMFPKKSVIFSR